MDENILNTLKSIRRETEEPEEEIDYSGFFQEENKNEESLFPKKLSDTTLEKRYIGLLLNEIQAISVYYFPYDECCFIDEDMMNIYKKVLFNDG